MSGDPKPQTGRTSHLWTITTVHSRDGTHLKKTSVVEICEAGMAKLVVPIFRDQNYLGSITTCGCKLPETEIETYFIEKTTGVSGHAVAEMSEKIPIVQKEQLQQLAEALFCRLNT